MAHFPFTHAEIMALAGEIKAGMTDRPDVYPAPTVDLADFAAKIDLFWQKDAAFIQANAAKLAATDERKEVLADLKTMIRKQLRYAENVTGFDDAKLKIIGWADKHPRTSAAPGQVLQLKATEQGTDYVVLNWQAPQEGGKPAAYKILRRDDSETGTWMIAGTSFKTTIKLTDQLRHIDLEYKVTAINKTGEGAPSNTIMVVL